jgi:serine/threonine protein kinase/tetratricopeptide (TPR) repeat protein
MVSAWARGERLTAEELLARHPGLSDEAAVRLIYEEVCLRRESGEEVATTEVVSRFPQWKDELEVLLGCDRLLRPFSWVAPFPEIGEELGPFRLVSELGRGASGRTYLAVEPALADRLVVLKVIPDDQEEHLSLARLQHTHIIPLFSEQSLPDLGLRALCMPYLGGTSLARILGALAEVPPGQRRGRHLLEALDRLQAGRPVSPTSEGPYRRYFEQASYVQAVCWIVACLADALHYAHAHGLIHMDVKPSNVLIAGDGLPMLLDFHLARRPIRSGERISDRLGGTPGWMAPEHRAALDAVSLGQPVPQPVDHRADLYALGLLLREALVGRVAAPEDAASQRSWRTLNGEVSVGLADVVQKCLAPKPSGRYHDAGALADDLRRHINAFPLRGVPNRSLAESWRKWRRRRPAALMRGTAWFTALAAGIVAVVLGLLYYRQCLHELQTALEDGQRFSNNGRFPEAVHALSRGRDRATELDRALIVPGVNSLRQALVEQLHRARRGQKAAELHDLADLVRFRYGLTPFAAAEARDVVRSIQAIWDERDLLLSPKAGTSDPKIDQGIRTDLLELAIVWAELRVQIAPPAETDAAKRDALRVLDQAQAACGPSPSLELVRRSITGVLGRIDSLPGPVSAPMSTWDHYDLGRSYLRAEQFREASREFQSVLDQRPQDFWPNFYQGICAYRLGQYSDALAAFRTCTALAPTKAECYYNRALAAEALGRGDRAFLDYGRALELDPGLTAAALNRGILSYRSGRHDEAVADFLRALRTSHDSRTVGRIHYNLALAHLARGDRPSALASAEEALARGHEEAHSLRDRLRRGS